jgi:hypothetical protein
MATLTRTELLAKPEVKDAMREVRGLLRAVLGSGGFAEREEALLTISEETCRGLLEEDLQES